MARILIADNNDPVRCTLAALLRSSGHEVDQVADGRQALVHFADRSFDAVLMDVYMPCMDGLEACRRLREGSQVPILMISAYGHPRIQEQALVSGADAFVCKPLEFDSVLDWICQVSSTRNRFTGNALICSN